MALPIFKARDGDGDGRVYDGTPKERPVGPGDTVGRGRGKKLKGKLTGSKDRSSSSSGKGKSRSSGGGRDKPAPKKPSAKYKGAGTKDDPYRGVKDADEALDLIADGKHVEMDPDTLGVTLGKLAEIGKAAFEAEKRGETVDVPDYDLCRVHVPKSNIFCVKNQGIPRIKMPQVKGKNIRKGSAAEKLLAKQNADRAAKGKDPELEVDSTEQFVAFLQTKGITIKDEVKVPAAKLKATQNQLVGSKVGGMMAARAAGKFDPAKDPIFVSSDNYVLDGHHRWAAVVGSEFGTGETIEMTTSVIDVPIQELVSLTNQFLDEFGILPNAATGTGKVTKEWMDLARKELPCIGCGDEIEKRKKAGKGPNPRSTPKEIVGSHGHRSHGKSILWPALYEHLRKKGMTKKKAAMISNGQWRKKHGLPPKGKGKASVTRLKKDDVVAGEISKVDPDKQLVYGWMYVTHNHDGEVVVDKSGDFIDDIEELEDAAVDFVLHSRQGGVDHRRDGDSPMVKSRLVESMVFTPEKVAALGLEPGSLPTGWWAGWKVDDDLWPDVKSGKYKSFSIHGSGVREAMIEKKSSMTPQEARRKAAEYTGKQVRSASRPGSLTSKERKQRIDAARASANARRGTGTKDKNPKTPETKANEMIRERKARDKVTEKRKDARTPGTEANKEALTQIRDAIKSGEPIKMNEDEFEEALEHAQEKNLTVERGDNGTAEIVLKNGRVIPLKMTGSRRKSQGSEEDES